MNHFQKCIFYVAFASLFLVAVSGAIIKADFFIKLDNGKGITKVVRSSDRDCRITDLPAGTYMFSVCDEKGVDLPVTAQFEYSQQTVAEAANDMANPTEFKPIDIGEGYNKTENQITVYEAGSIIDCKAIVLPQEKN